MVNFKFTADELSEMIKERDSSKLAEWGGVEGIAAGLGSDIKNGLSDEGEFIERGERFGRNFYATTPPDPLWKLILEALQDRTLQILIVAAFVSIILGVTVGHGGHNNNNPPATPTGTGSDGYEYDYGSGSPSPSMFLRDIMDSLSGSGNTEGAEIGGWVEGVAILVAVVLVVSVSAINDYNKERQFRKLSAENDDVDVKVCREGAERTINIKTVQVGDILLLENGDVIAADGLLIDGFGIACDESAMTGESRAVRKGADGDGGLWMLSNCKVLEGTGRMLVTAVGPNSEWGKIKMSLDTEREDTPLQEKLDALAELIGKLGLAAAALTFVALMINRAVVLAKDPNLQWSVDEFGYYVDYVIIAVTIVVVAVPEGLPLAVTISLAYSMTKMMQDNNLVRHLAACETMGGATNICSDKTGTLTQNKMTVTEGCVAGQLFKNDEPINLHEDVKFLLLENISLNSSAYAQVKNGVRTLEGNATEQALLGFVESSFSGYDWNNTRKSAVIVQKFPFSSKAKQMSTVVQVSADRVRLYKKGAPEALIQNCSHLLDNKGELVQITDQIRTELLRSVENMASNGLRTLGFGYAEYMAPVTFESPPDEGIIFVGVVGIKDPLRKEVPAAIEVCKKAGITVRMVTGDSILTAEHIAKECGILSEDGICIEGPRFRKLSDKEIDNMIPRLQVIARASPNDKLILVKRLKALGEVVASTGDGVNDALQLKEADVGFSMGITGSSVAKEASDIILMDDNFASIAKACMWGRNVYDSIRKFLQFQLTVNIGAVVIAFVGAVVPSIGDSPLSAVQMLWVNLIMDTFAALALATEPPSPKLLDRPPYGRYDSLITNTMWRMIIGMTAYQLVVLFVLLFGLGHPHMDGFFGGIDLNTSEGVLKRGTIIFNTFVLCQLANEINCRKLGNEINVFANFFDNYLFIAIVIGSGIVQALLVEFGGAVVPSSGLTGKEWLGCIIIALISIPYAAILKLIPVPEDKIGKKGDEEETQPLLSSNRSIIPLASKWHLVKKVVSQLRVINAFRRQHR